MFSTGLERVVTLAQGKERNEEIIGDKDIEPFGSLSIAFCFFLKQIPFHVLFPATVRIDGPYLFVGSKLQDLLQAKLSEQATDNFVSSGLLVLFWFHQIQLLYRIKTSPELEQLSGTCSILIEKMLSQLKVEQPDSGIDQDPFSAQCILEVAEVILCHPVVMLSLECPLLITEEFTEGIFQGSLENFLLLARQGIPNMDHHVLNLLISISETLATFCNAQTSIVAVDSRHKRILKAVKALVKKLNQILRDRFDQCIKTEDFRPLAPTLYALHTLMRFISPVELLEVVLWMFSRIELSDSRLRVSSKCSAFSVGLLIAGCAFDMVSAYLQGPYTKGVLEIIFWGMEEKSFDVLLFEDIYFHVIEIAMRFELDVADLCLLKAVNVGNIRKGYYSVVSHTGRAMFLENMFKVEYTGFSPPSMEELHNILSSSLLGKAIVMLRYYFALNRDAVKMKKRLKLFVSVCPCSDAHDDILDCDVSDIATYSYDQSLNLVNRVVAKIHFCRMLLFPKDNQVQPLLKEDVNTKEIHSEVGSNKVDLSRIQFLNILVRTWQLTVKKFPSKFDGSGKTLGTNYFLFRFLESFILRNILELSREMDNCLIKQNSLPVIEQLARFSLLHRFGEPDTLKMLRGVLTSVSDGNLHILVLQLLLAHSQFAPIIRSVSITGGSQFGVIFRPMASILRLLVIPSTNQSALGGDNNLRKTSELYGKRELLLLLLSSYGATLSELDLEIYNLMLDIESADEPSCGSIGEMDYLWGSAVMKIIREQEQDPLSDNTNDVAAVREHRRIQFRENLPIDPKMCACTVLHFPYDRTVGEVQHGNSEGMIETHHDDVRTKQTYDPVFILRFSIHSLSMGYVEPIEFASLGLLAIAFVSISSPDDEMRKLGYEALGRFKTALEVLLSFIRIVDFGTR
ncbi:hypothetical protein Acr_24g0009300 [Actinidia rufa]|uniref:Uncharacterized protein n=1 Tax=Actinidia rufa TaxID=165716 RepID=A0A7J0GV67_9ERIC|nr:hypothetical protein Acr_24g0009300 [Actinidia rufa]